MFKNPILLLTYKRPKTTKIIIERILSINPKKLYIFQDGPKKKFNISDKLLHKETFELINRYKKTSKGTEVLFFSFKKNIGQRFIANKVLNIVFRNEKEIIFLEDDTYPDLSFFNYCSSMLKRFENDKNIYHISGCNLFYGLNKKKISKEKIFLSKYPQFWGWATWKKKWKKYYNPEILDWKKNKDYFLKKCIDSDGEHRFFNHYITKNAKGHHIGWDVPWIYKLVLNSKKTLLPNINLIKNLGYKHNPEGKGAKKFRNLKISKLEEFNTDVKKIKHNLDYDIFLRESFYHRKKIGVIIKNKLIKIVKTFSDHS